MNLSTVVSKLLHHPVTKLGPNNKHCLIVVDGFLSVSLLFILVMCGSCCYANSYIVYRPLVPSRFIGLFTSINRREL